MDTQWKHTSKITDEVRNKSIIKPGLPFLFPHRRYLLPPPKGPTHRRHLGNTLTGLEEEVKVVAKDRTMSQF